MIQHLQRCLLLVPIFIGTSCSVNEYLDTARAELKESYDKLPAYETLPRRTVSWQQAWAMVEKNNLELKQARQTLDDARRKENNTFRNLIPQVNLGYYYSMALFGNNQETYTPNGRFDINIIFSIPELINLPIDYYTAALTTYKAEQNLEQKRRELISRLYKLFREEEIQIASDGADDDLWQDDPETNAHSIRKQRDLQQRERWLQICAFLNNYEAHWQLHSGSIPRITPKDYKEKMKRPGDVSVTLAAMELEASRLRKLGIALDYWPSLHASFYSPTLFNMSGGNMGGFMKMDDVRLDMNSYFSLDTRLTTWNEYQDAKVQHELLLQQLKQRMYEHREKIALLMRSWTEFENWKQAMEEYIHFRRSQGATDPENARKMHSESISIRKSILDQDRKNLERECALIQEYGLPEKKASAIPGK